MKTDALDLGLFKLEDIPLAVILIKPSVTPDLAATKAACKPVAKLDQHVTALDGTQKAGERFTKTWRIENTGNCAFDEGSLLVFKSGDRLSGPEAGVALPQIKPGDKAEVSIRLVAPPLGETYSGVWEIRRANGDPIGQLAVNIVVLGPTATRPPTLPPPATPTPQNTPTPAPGTGPIGPVGSGPLTASWAGNFWNCVATLVNEGEPTAYWMWTADFFIKVYGGNAGYTITSTDCKWNYAQQRYACRWSARADGAVVQNVVVSCPDCTPVTVSVRAEARLDGTACRPK